MVLKWCSAWVYSVGCRDGYRTVFMIPAAVLDTSIILIKNFQYWDLDQGGYTVYGNGSTKLILRPPALTCSKTVAVFTCW